MKSWIQAEPPRETSWNPGQYLRFADQRLRPALELLERIPLDTPKVIYDLGCGTGEVTRLIARRWPSAVVYGLDSSPEMLQNARAEAGEIHWLQADITGWEPEQAPDLIYANASLHWIDGHGGLFPRLVGYLTPGGCLAVQMPLSWGQPSHRLMRETLANGGKDGGSLGSEALRQAARRKWVGEAKEYYDLLSTRVRSLDIWETEVLQVLEGEDPVLEWVKGTGLRPILTSLEGDEREIFLAEYRRRLRAAYPAGPDGRTLYPFRRLFIVTCARHRLPGEAAPATPV